MDADRQLWTDLLAADRALLGRNWAFLQGATDPAAVLAAALRATGAERGAALRFLLVAAPDELKLATLPQLVFLASGQCSDTSLVQGVIQSIADRQRLIQSIQPIAEELLADGDDETYLKIAELYSELSDDLLRDHLARCAAHPDPMVREVVTYFED